MNENSVTVALIEIMPGLIWPILIVSILFFFRSTIYLFAQAIKTRLEAGEPLKFWVFELERLATPSKVQIRETGKIRTIEDKIRQKEIEKFKQGAKNLMLVDVTYKR